MTNLSHTNSGGRGISRRKRSFTAGLATVCGLWLALLSPKAILGLPAGSGTSRQNQPSSIVVAKASPQVSFEDPTPIALTISPVQSSIAVGRKLIFRLHDSRGRAIHGATWMVSDFTVAELDSIDPARIAAVGPGEVTVTATLGDQMVQAKVSVVVVQRSSSGCSYVNSSPSRGR